MQVEGEDRVRAIYRENFERLAELKGRFDPHFLFSVNWGIRPQEQAQEAPVIGPRLPGQGSRRA